MVTLLLGVKRVETSTEYSLQPSHYRPFNVPFQKLSSQLLLVRWKYLPFQKGLFLPDDPNLVRTSVIQNHYGKAQPTAFELPTPLTKGLICWIPWQSLLWNPDRGLWMENVRSRRQKQENSQKWMNCKENNILMGKHNQGNRKLKKNHTEEGRNKPIWEKDRMYKQQVNAEWCGFLQECRNFTFVYLRNGNLIFCFSWQTRQTPYECFCSDVSDIDL